MWYAQGMLLETFAEHRAKAFALAEAALVTANVITGKFKDPKEALQPMADADVADAPGRYAACPSRRNSACGW